MIFIIDDDEIMAECIARVCVDKDVQVFTNAIEAMEGFSKFGVPKLIFLDILLDGPDGFTFLNELASYDDTKKIPIVVVSSLDFKNQDLSAYGVVETLNKDVMMPEEIKQCVERYDG